MTLSASSAGLSGRSVLVTGGAGFIGSHLVDRLLAEDVGRVVVVDNFFLGTEANLIQARTTGRVEVVRMDAANLAAMLDIASAHEIDTLFDLAVVPLPTSLTYPEWTIATNIGITTTACELARLDAVRRVVHCSSSEVYGSARYVPMDEEHPHDSITPYAASKSGADRVVYSYVKTFGIHAATVRPFNNFGPRQNSGSYAGIIPIVVQRVLAGLPIEIHGDGEQTRDFTFVRDTAEQIVRVAKSDACAGQVVNIASGVETTIESLIAQLLDVLGVPSYPTTHADPRPGDVRRHLADTAKAEKLINFKPKPLSSAALAETVEWYRSKLG